MSMGFATRIARFEQAGEVREISLLYGMGDSLTVRECSSGPQTQIAYGEHDHLTEITFNGTSWDVWKFFSREDAYLTDLMDRLDAVGLEYSYMSWGPLTGVVYRPPLAA